MISLMRVDVPESLLLKRGRGRTKANEEGRCRMCRRPDYVRLLTRHHLVPQSWFNRRSFAIVADAQIGTARVVCRNDVRDVDANIVPLCSPCHVGVESDPEFRWLLRKSLGSCEAAYVVALRGQEWFDRTYPEASPCAAARGERDAAVI